VVRAGGRDRLHYEIHITNWVDDFDVTLLRVEILLGDEAVALEGEGRNKLTIAAGTKLAPGVRSVVLMQLTDDRFQRPSAIGLLIRLPAKPSRALWSAPNTCSDGRGPDCIAGCRERMDGLERPGQQPAPSRRCDCLERPRYHLSALGF
jgi:hypothetical protein